MSFDDHAASTIEPPKAERICEERIVWQLPRLMTFEQYLDQFEGRREHIELVEGVPVERMAAELPHEELFAWLFPLMVLHASKYGLGKVLGSRTAVKIDRFGGRLPDILFIRQEHKDRLLEHGVPDLVIEIRSPGDRPSAQLELERDYRTVEIPEIVFMDPKHRTLRALRLRDNEYEETVVASGVFKSELMTGLALDLTWLFDEPRPDILETLGAIKNLAD